MGFNPHAVAAKPPAQGRATARSGGVGVGGAALADSGRRRIGAALALLGLAGLVRNYARARADGRATTAEHVSRMRRLQPEAVAAYYRAYTSSMESAVTNFPRRPAKT